MLNKCLKFIGSKLTINQILHQANSTLNEETALKILKDQVKELRWNVREKTKLSKSNMTAVYKNSIPKYTQSDTKIIIMSLKGNVM